jgi:hypothetical protein
MVRRDNDNFMAVVRNLTKESPSGLHPQTDVLNTLVTLAAQTDAIACRPRSQGGSEDMAWVTDCFELAASASLWARRMDLPSKVARKLRKAVIQLLEAEPDIAIARKIARIAADAGFGGPELDKVTEALKDAELQVRQAKRAASARKIAGKSTGKAKANGKQKGRRSASDPVISRLKSVRSHLAPVPRPG